MTRGSEVRSYSQAHLRADGGNQTPPDLLPLAAAGCGADDEMNLQVEATNILVRVELPLPPSPMPPSQPVASSPRCYARGHCSQPLTRTPSCQQQQQQEQQQPGAEHRGSAVPVKDEEEEEEKEEEVAIATLHVDRFLFWDCSAEPKDGRDGQHAAPCAPQPHAGLDGHSTVSGSSSSSSSSSKGSGGAQSGGAGWRGWGRALGCVPPLPTTTAIPHAAADPLGADPGFWSHFRPAAAMPLPPGRRHAGSGGGAGSGSGGEGSAADAGLSQDWGVSVQRVAEKAVLVGGVRVDLRTGGALRLGGEGEEEAGAWVPSLASSLCASAGGSFMSAATGEDHTIMIVLWVSVCLCGGVCV